MTGRAGAAALVLGLVAVTSPARAEPGPPGGAPPTAPPLAISPPAPGAVLAPRRTGFTAGAELGLGGMSMECASCEASLDGGGGLAVHVGGLLDSCLAILYDGWVMVHRDDSLLGDVTATLSSHVVALQGWFHPRLWARGGAGVSNFRLRYHGIGTRSDTVPALVGAVGVEAWRTGPLVLDVVLRGSAAFFDEDEGQDDAIYSVGLGAGVSWY